MTTVVPVGPVGRTWASIVLARRSQLAHPEKAEVPNELSDCPGRPDAGQMDRSTSSFQISLAAISLANGQGDVSIPQDWADGLSRLRPDRPPGDVPVRRWHQLIDDINAFVGEGWAARAQALGWASSDLFAADRERPFARIDFAGLLWLLNGNRVVALCETTATIETNTGAKQTYRRRSQEPGRVLAWEL
jgi:hypothetical protein